MQYCEMSKEELLKLKEELDETYKEAQSKGLSLNMSRGKPSATQLNITMDLVFSMVFRKLRSLWQI